MTIRPSTSRPTAPEPSPETGTATGDGPPLSLGSGTSGGVLAPVFMIGGALGALEGHLLPHVFPGFWAMAGLRSPLTSIVFTLELTHAWNDLTPLLVSSVSAYLLSVLLLKRSVLTEKIARRGLHLTREYSTDHHEEHHRQRHLTLRPPSAPNPGHPTHTARIAHPAHPRQRTNTPSEEE